MTAPAAAGEGTWFGQPPGLTILFLTEMWEKFSFYGMRALLVYYMTKQLLLKQADASVIYGLYTGFVYFTPVIGGMISDRWLSRRQAVLTGGAIMALGHFMMASESLLLPALATIAIGNGFFLPNLPSQIGDLYGREDPRRGSAYNVYYVGINLGAFLAPLGCGTVGELFGWHWGFTLAGFGMLTGLAIYILGSRHLPQQASRRQPRAPSRASTARDAATPLLLLGVGLAVVVLRGAYEQIGNTVALWTDEQVNRTVAGGLVVPLTWFQALNPLLVFLLTPFFVAHWTRQAAKGREPAAAVKMAIGAGGIALAYLLLAAAAALAQHQGHPASWLWLAAFVAVLTAAELFVLPVGLGLFARLAPVQLASTTIAAWFFTSFFGNLLAGLLGTFWGRLDHGVYFALMAALAGVASGLLYALDRPTQAAEARGLAAAQAGQSFGN